MKCNFLRTAAIALLCAATVCSCGKDGADGKDGNDGTNGANGTNGEKGEQGIPGNAGVKMYIWGERVVTGDTTYEIPIPYEEIENYLINAYACISGSWIPVPLAAMDGISIDYALWKYGNITYLIVYLTKADGSVYASPVTFDAFRVIVVPVPAENITQMSVKSSSVDYGNYAEVAAYYGLPE